MPAILQINSAPRQRRNACSMDDSKPQNEQTIEISMPPSEKSTCREPISGKLPKKQSDPRVSLHSLYPDCVNPPSWHWSAYVDKVSSRHPRAVRSTSHPPILTPMKKIRNGKNHVSKLPTKEIGDNLGPQASPISSDQLANPKMVIHLHADISQST